MSRKKDFNYWKLWQNSIELIDEFESKIKKVNEPFTTDELVLAMRAYQHVISVQGEELLDLQELINKIKLSLDNHCTKS